MTPLVLNVQILHSELLPRHPRPHLGVPAGQGAAQQRAVRGGAAGGGVHPPPRARHHPLHGHRRRGGGDHQVPPGPVLQVGTHHQLCHSMTWFLVYHRAETERLGLEIGAKRSTSLGRNIYAGRNTGETRRCSKKKINKNSFECHFFRRCGGGGRQTGSLGPWCWGETFLSPQHPFPLQRGYQWRTGKGDLYLCFFDIHV